MAAFQNSLALLCMAFLLRLSMARPSDVAGGIAALLDVPHLL